MTGSIDVKPSLTETTAPFWEGLGQGELRVFRCSNCGASYWPYTACVNHDNEPYLANMSWVAASGKGRLHAYNVHMQPMSPSFPTPYVYAVVELDEGPMIIGNIEGDWTRDDPLSLRVGQRLEAVFVPVGDSHTVLSFRVVPEES